MSGMAQRVEPAPADTLELRPAELRHLAAVRDFVAARCRDAGADAAACDALVLAADEVCANVLLHGYGGAGGPLRVAVRAEDGRLALTIADEAPPFDPRALPAPAPGDDPLARAPGGLGWHLVRQSVDEVRWRAVAGGGGNEVTLVKQRVTRDA